MTLKRPQYSGLVATPATAEATGRAYVPPVYTLRPAEPCPFTVATQRNAQIEAALTRLVNPPSLVCTSNRTVGTVDWTVALYSDDTVQIITDNEPVATGRFATQSHVTAWGSLSVESRIVDVTPAAVVSADIVESLAGDLTYFAMRAGRFSH
jgi:hypothetical protein